MTNSAEIDAILQAVVARVAKVDGVAAIVLGGSLARGTADERSDIDLGIYYDGERPFSIEALSAAAQELDDRHAPGLVSGFGEWGPGVNGGGWLEIRGHHVDFLYRELDAVRGAVEDCVEGRPHSVHQLGHPLGFHIQIYAGEINICRPLYDPAGKVAALKAVVAEYPDKLGRAVIVKHLFDAGFEVMIAANPALRGDVMYVAGCLFRAAGFMTLVLYALNRRFFINEKGAASESRGFAIKLAEFHDIVEQVLGNLGRTPAELSASVAKFETLVESIRHLSSNS